MQIERFKRILTAFADTPANVDVSKGKLLVEIRDEIIEADIRTSEGTLFVTEGGDDFRAATWIIHRIARLPLLADRILTHVPKEPFFVRPSGSLLDQLEESPSDKEQPIEDAAKTAVDVLTRRPAGTASVLYLTSDAGEGKTTLISEIARSQAELYKQKQTDWLLVPVSLGGRTFMRFDDVIIGALVNRLRFQLFFYDAFIELVRLGVLVPALDGFEEMFVEGAAGDAISALGNLMETLQSEGTVLIAARKAYFEYKGLHTQAKLFDSLGGQAVSFARVALDRWNQQHFLEYANKRGVPNAADIYGEVSAKLSQDHPLLTRAVLVRQLLDVATEGTARSTLLQKIESDPDDYFRQFVGSIIAREASEKWIDKVGQPAQPLLTVDEHYELLASVAGEMWTAQSEAIGSDVLDFVGEIFAEGKHKDKVVTHQIVERLKQHALIVKADEYGRKFCFDHQEFYHFFLGEAVGEMLQQQEVNNIRHAFRQGVLPNLAIDSAARFVIRNGVPTQEIVETVNAICENEPRASFARENLGGLVIRLIDFQKKESVSVIVCHATFPTNCLTARRLRDARFEDCYFQSTTLAHSRLTNCLFHECEFERVDFGEVSEVSGIVFENCTVRSAVAGNSDAVVFAPQQVAHVLSEMGIEVRAPEAERGEEPVQIDERLAIVERVLRIFLRSTGVNEFTLRQRLGSQASVFFDDVLPPLEDRRVFVEVRFRGSGKQRRFELGVPLERVSQALEECEGGFDRFLELAGAQ